MMILQKKLNRNNKEESIMITCNIIWSLIKMMNINIHQMKKKKIILKILSEMTTIIESLKKYHILLQNSKINPCRSNRKVSCKL